MDVLLRILAVLLIAVPLFAFGQGAPYLVRDLPGLTIHDSMLYGQTCFWANTGNITWFTAMTASGGREIFKTDGTAAGTVQVTHGTGVPESQYNGPFLGLLNGLLIYGGVDAGGQGVFALDTNGGDPILLHRFQLAYLTNGLVRDGVLYFSARTDTSTEHELWVTGGTPFATTKIELLPGEQGAFNGSPNTRLYSAGPWMYFFGTTPQGAGLHRTDGTAENTLLIVPFPKFIFGSYTSVASFEDRLIVSFADSPTQSELWATDGTTTGTVQIATIRSFTPIGVAGGKLLFVNTGVWTTDGTPAGTHPSEIVQRFTALSGPMSASRGRVIGNRLFFISGAWLYVTDGTAAGTQSNFFVKQGATFPNEGFVIGDSYYFRNDDGVHGMELWRTDGTTTELVADINPGLRNGLDDATGFVRPDGKVLFAATNYNTGREPWITDGTTAGTHLLQDIAADDALNGSSPSELSATGAELFFKANLTGGQAIGMSDGTSDGTAATLLDYPSSISNAVAANGHYFFLNVDGLYSSDGTSAGTTKIHNQPREVQPLANGLLFFADDDGGLWFSDGTIAGTRKLRSFGPFAAPPMFPEGTFAWIANDHELWKTDGSVAGTVQVPLNPAPTNEIYELVDTGSRIYFLETSSSTHGNRLWRADRDGSNAMIVKDLGNNSRFVGATAHMVYLDIDGKLYRSDGTDGGTYALPGGLPAGIGTTCSSISTALGDTLLFISSTNSYFNPVLTLWCSDGTVAGTTALQVMLPPQTFDGDVCRHLLARGNNVYYSGWDADHGWELWQSDGTASGTRLTADIYPGPQSSFPRELTLAGGRIFFSADSPSIGRELWAFIPPTTRHRAARP